MQDTRILQEAFVKLAHTEFVDDSFVNFVIKSIDLPGEVIDAELVSPPAEKSTIVLHITVHSGKELQAKVLEATVAVFKDGKIQSYEIREIGQLPWDIVEIVNNLSRRPRVQYRQDSRLPTPSQYPHPLDSRDLPHSDFLLG